MKKFSLSRKHLLIPYAAFFVLFVALPLILVLIYAFTDNSWHFTFNNIGKFFTDIATLSSLALSLVSAVATTAICLVIAYPLAYFLANRNYNRSSVLILLFILPMWINFLLRTLAIKELLFLMQLPLGVGATILGMVYDFLPFMILPIYNSLQKLDRSYIEAAEDLGAKPLQVFVKTTIPLSMPGIISGVMMVFMPTISAYAISDMLTNRDIYFFGTNINFLFTGGANDFHYGSALAFIMLLLVGIVMLITSKYDKSEDSTLW